MQQIIPGLWLGSRPDESQVEHLRKKNISSILTIEKTPLSLRLPSFKRMFISIDDLPGENIFVHFERAFNFIDANISKGVLVH
ncbi:hypothetical protein ACTXT7_016697, partial [Hymenolepis weldensis]